ncbi:db1bd415-0fff-4383-b05a-bb2dbbc33c69 [Thermothielavioides terrestris]|uniref:Db1bd415-0fff-4383-b05a-bb2dbbc33c69 n=1 Tax=Thermothielavioides terrestris TaxID=2587410 RepID=A0A3S5CW28_9PEZI|nr:db1bd415-0fff-4383-b05a-bb2dbbc33c69 [Thermothielavioides terrestris]
MDIINNTR